MWIAVDVDGHKSPPPAGRHSASPVQLFSSLWVPKTLINPWGPSSLQTRVCTQCDDEMEVSFRELRDAPTAPTCYAMCGWWLEL